MKIKLLVALSLVTFIVSVTAILAAGLVVYELKRPQNGLISRIINPNATPGTGQSEMLQSEGSLVPQAVVPTLTTEELGKHSEPKDCWITIENNVYDVSGYLVLHPGGANEITPYCGKDATTAFATKGKNPGSSHSQTAVNILAGYYIGTLGEPVDGNGQIAQLSVSPRAVPRSVPGQTTVNRPLYTTPAVAPVNNAATAQVSLTLAEVATHNTLQNCWIVVSGTVYDVTRYISSHPGGVSAITNTCGTDATQAFQTRGGKGSHSQNAYNLLSQYAIGTLGSSVTVNPPTSGSTTKPPPPPPENKKEKKIVSSASLPASVQSKYPDATVKKDKVEDDGRHDIQLLIDGECRKIKTDASGNITSDKSC